MRQPLSLVLVLGLCGVALETRAADSCSVDEDCPDGQICMPSPCPAIACEDPTDCPVCESQGVCTDPGSGDDGGWWGQECAEDQDCPFGFTCKEVAVPCANAGCAPCACDCRSDEEECDCECPECPEPEPCEPETLRVCVYEAKECTEDSDCPEGFACVAQEVCSGGCACGGCSCPPCPEGESCPPCDCEEPEPCFCDDDPSCEVLGQYCQPKEIPCQEDSQCPQDWTCVDFESSSCRCPDCACPAPEGEEPPDCTCEPCDCEPGTTEGFCLPPGWEDSPFVGSDSGIPEPNGTPTGGTGTENGTPREADGQDQGVTAPATDPATGMVEPKKGGCAAGTAADALPLAMLLLGMALRRRRP